MISNIAKAMSSEEHINRSLDTGKNGEDNFKLACKLNNIDCFESDEENNIYNHIDFWILGMGVDVKGYKNSHSKGFVVVEFKNVNGYAGSCSKQSKAELIAFQFNGYFMIVRKQELLEYCRKEVELIYVTSFNECYKKLYQRTGRKDLMTMLSVNDLKSFKFLLNLHFI
jgi:hypothetical protein